MGANLTNVSIPPRSLPVPYVRRLLIVYHDLGNWSSIYNDVPGYTLLTSVIGIMIYNASNMNSTKLTKLDLKATEKPILIQFNSSITPSGSNPRAKCTTFDAYGRVTMSEMSLPNVCQTRTLGYFSIETPSKQRKVWIFWVLGFVLGFLCLVFVVLLIGTILLRALTVKRTNDMEREADEGEVLHTFWVNSSKMPRATITRTHPDLENLGRP
ncbi:OLC1v1029934C1 [Oldenlandia corymbosa var. corymbosa]|uniref:OLC1v1029934C1 n=1 Tax=Oldenlandia corymbosa var. corymbosa TaxID=529605 RepID=A0AAV1CGF9_OLDCO|nr:OLC1v1029934C1 [Oldenlandia corymbosa var. corymbosa]